MGKKTFFLLTLNFWEYRFGGKNCVNNDKSKMATKQNKSNDNIFEVISYLHIQGSKFGRKIDKFGGKSFFKLDLG